MENLLPNFHWTNLLFIPGLLVGYAVHGLARSFTAYALGDYSQVEQGRITLNPFQHISWSGALGFIFFGPMGLILFSWLTFILGGKRWSNNLRLNLNNFRRKYPDTALVSTVGLISCCTATLAGLLLTLSTSALLVYGSNASTDEVFLFLFPIVDSLPSTLNLQAWSMAVTSYLTMALFWIALVNLLPLPGMDSFIILISLVAYFREKSNKKSIPQQSNPISRPAKPQQPINQYKRRNNVSDIHFKIGTEYHATQSYDDAIARYRQAINADQYFGPAYVNMGLAYAAKGKRREAIQSFRGAIQYADDQKSQTESWYQLHLLSEVSPVNLEAAQEDLAELGASPWTDTKPKPNWLGLSISTVLILAATLVLYGYLITNLVEMF